MKKNPQYCKCYFLGSPAVQFDSLNYHMKLWSSNLFLTEIAKRCFLWIEIFGYSKWGINRIVHYFCLQMQKNCLVQIIIKSHRWFFSIFFTNLMHCYWPYWVRTHVQQAPKLLLFQFDCFYVPFNFKCLENKCTMGGVPYTQPPVPVPCL